VHGEVVRLTDTKAVTQPLPPPPKPAAAAAGAPAEPAGGADAGGVCNLCTPPAAVTRQQGLQQDNL